MSVIGSLNVNISAQTKDLEKGLKVAQQKIAELKQKASDKIQNPFAGWGSTIATVLGGAAIAGVVNKFDDMADTIDRLGVSAETFQQLGYAAQFTGATTEDLATAMQKLSVNVNEAFHSGNNDSVFAEMGLDVAELVKMKPDEMFLAVGEAIKSIENPSTQMRLAVEAAGKAAGKMVPLFRQGRDAIKDAKKDLDGFGGALSQEDLNKISFVKDTFDKIKTQIELIIAKLTIKFQPIIEKIWEDMKGFGKFVLDFFDKWGTQLKYAIELWVAYKATMMAYNTVLKATAALKAVIAAIDEGGWKAILKGALIAGTVMGVLYAIDSKITEWMKVPPDPTLPTKPKTGGDVPEVKTKAEKIARDLHVSGAAERGSQEAFKIANEAGKDHLKTLVETTRQELGFIKQIDQTLKNIYNLPGVNAAVGI